MPNRILRDGIIESRAVNSLSDSGEIFYRRLMSLVDDYGRCEADVDILRPRLFGRSLDRWPPSRVSQALAEVSGCLTDDGHPLVTVYCVSNKNYLQINNFRQRTRAEKSRCPSPDGQMAVTCLTSARLDGVVVGDGVGYGDGVELSKNPVAVSEIEAGVKTTQTTIPDQPTTTNDDSKIGLAEAIEKTTGVKPDRNLIRTIRDLLEVRGKTVEEFVADTVPRCSRTKKRPGPGFWRTQAEVFAKPLPQESPPKTLRLPANCGRCSDTGKFPNGQFCDCRVGALARDLEQVNANGARPSPKRGEGFESAGALLAKTKT